MAHESLTDEQLKDRVIKQALARHVTLARQTASLISDRHYLRDAWQALLFIEAGRKDVAGVKDTILACPDPSLFTCHAYRDMPIGFYKDGNLSAAIKITLAMGKFGSFPLLLIAASLAEKGDRNGVNETLAHIKDDALKALIMEALEKSQVKNKNSG